LAVQNYKTDECPCWPFYPAVTNAHAVRGCLTWLLVTGGFPLLVPYGGLIVICSGWIMSRLFMRVMMIRFPELYEPHPEEASLNAMAVSSYRPTRPFAWRLLWVLGW
jgi:hypothetical protein